MYPEVYWTKFCSVQIFHVFVLAGTDPCFDASQTCHEHADCVPADQSFRCVCRAGYKGNGMDCQGNCSVFKVKVTVKVKNISECVSG